MTREAAFAFVKENGPKMTEALNVITGRTPESTASVVRPLGVVESEAQRESAGTGARVECEPENESASDSAPPSAPTPVPADVAGPVECLGWRSLTALALRYPEAVGPREFEYMKPGEKYPEMTVECLHVQGAAFTVVLPLSPLSCEVRCDICREHPHLEELCPSCHGTKKRTMTVADVLHFLDAGDRYGSRGTFWRMVRA